MGGIINDILNDSAKLMHNTKYSANHYRPYYSPGVEVNQEFDVIHTLINICIISSKMLTLFPKHLPEDSDVFVLGLILSKQFI